MLLSRLILQQCSNNKSSQNRAMNHHDPISTRHKRKRDVEEQEEEDSNTAASPDNDAADGLNSSSHDKRATNGQWQPSSLHSKTEPSKQLRNKSVNHNHSSITTSTIVHHNPDNSSPPLRQRLSLPTLPQALLRHVASYLSIYDAEQLGAAHSSLEAQLATLERLQHYWWPAVVSRKT